MKEVAILFLLSLISLPIFANEKMVIGGDDRIQIKKKNMTEAHQSVGLILSIQGNLIYQCSGTIIAPKLVITAAHCVNKKAKMYFVPGQISRIWQDIIVRLPRKAVPVKEAHPFPDYSKAQALTKDIAVLVFDKEFQARPLSLSTQYSQDEFVSIAGYPNDKRDGTMWEGSGRIDGASYVIDTYGGQSGSALRNQQNEIIGIHSFADHSKNKNFACLITQEHIDFIEEFL